MKTKIPTLERGYKRQWVSCKKCHEIYYYDYIPYGLSSPYMILPCNHASLGSGNNSGVRYIREQEALKRLNRKKLKC